MGKSNLRTILVYSDWEGTKGPHLMGELRAAPGKGKEVFSFEYDPNWIKSPFAQVLDPELELYSSQHFVSDTEEFNFGVFLDSSPDRWGRTLMLRREAAMAREEKREERRLVESDYLLGVHDSHRMGALRFKLTPVGSFLSDNRELASPPWTSLRELENASLQLEREDAHKDPNYTKWLALLIAPGSSLGGARPKASVIDPEDNPWIGKFPSHKDDYDLSAWEMVAHQLAKKSGIDMAEAKIQKFSSDHNTFLTKRFDRTTTGGRLHFCSAMTLLGRNDGESREVGASYLEIADILVTKGANPNPDLEELWRRIVFSIAISNTDDHLRNHGFMLTPKGWELSPAYDLNPNPDGHGLHLNISETSNELSFELALSVADQFRLSEQKAKQILAQVTESVSTWQETAKDLSISTSEIGRMKRAFRYTI